MSLLDILCGALGAFCFMLLVTLGSYVPADTAAALAQKTKELMDELEKVRQQQGASTTPAMQDLYQRMEDQINQLQGRVNQLTRDNEGLTSENGTQASKLKQRKPFLVMGVALDLTQDLDMFLQDDLVAEGGTASPNSIFDPNKKFNNSNWRDDITNVALPDRGFSIWVASDTVPRGHYKVFVKLANDGARRKPTNVLALGLGSFAKGRTVSLATTTLSPARFWACLGTLTVDNDYNLGFAEADQAQRDQEWRKLMRADPPPQPTPVAEVTPTPATAPAVTAQPTPAAAATMSEEERRARRERYMKEHGAQVPAQSPTP
jgi:ElaB/YqjD/DUF883 family membrane-anchored ribosome-binding protein